jgi:hypothetical protein
MVSPLKDNDSFSVQLETVRLNRVCAKNMIKNLTEMVVKLSEEIGYLRKDNEMLEMKMETISASKRPSVAYVQDSLARCDVNSSAAPENSGMMIYKEAL